MSDELTVAMEARRMRYQQSRTLTKLLPATQPELHPEPQPTTMPQPVQSFFSKYPPAIRRIPPLDVADVADDDTQPGGDTGVIAGEAPRDDAADQMQVIVMIRRGQEHNTATNIL